MASSFLRLAKQLESIPLLVLCWDGVGFRKTGGWQSLIFMEFTHSWLPTVPSCVHFNTHSQLFGAARFHSNRSGMTRSWTPSIYLFGVGFWSVTAPSSSPSSFSPTLPGVLMLLLVNAVEYQAYNFDFWWLLTSFTSDGHCLAIVLHASVFLSISLTLSSTYFHLPWIRQRLSQEI